MLFWLFLTKLNFSIKTFRVINCLVIFLNLGSRATYISIIGKLSHIIHTYRVSG